MRKSDLSEPGDRPPPAADQPGRPQPGRPQATPASLAAWLDELAALGISLAPDNGNLKVRGPAGAVTPEIRRRLGEQKALILAHLSGALPRLAQRQGGRTIAPLTSNQRRLWFIEQLDQGGGAFNLPLACLLRGPLNLTALEAAFAALRRRHAVLNSRVVDGPQGLTQVADPDAPFRLAVEAAPAGADPQRLAAEEAARPFDLAAGPPLRARLLQLAPARFLLLITVHHIVSDQWSMGLLARELGALYRAFAAGEDDPLPPLTVQYADYAAWQQESLSDQTLARGLEFWRGYLAGAPDELPLPGDRPRPEVRSGRGAALTFLLPRETTAPLLELGLTQKATPFMTFLALWAVLLARWSGRDDVCVGCPVDNRDRDELRGVMGFFVNTVVLRLDLSGRPGFRELLGRVRASCLEALAHAAFPFERLVEALRPQRALNRNPLFQNMFVLQATPPQPLELWGLEVEHLPLSPPGVEFDFNLALAQCPQGLQGHLEYDPDLFDAATAQRLVEQYGQLAAAAAARPDDPVTALPLLTPEGRRRVLELGAGPPAPEALSSLPALIARRAERTPAALAVQTPEGVLTYGELGRRARGMARRLRGLGAGPGALVGLASGRGASFMTGALAIMATGAAYVVLDPGQPDARLAALVADTGLTLALAGPEMAGRLPATVRLVAPGGDDPAPPDGEQGPPPPETDPRGLAYVCFTSGSTGRPKGVMVEQRSLVNHALAVREAYGLLPTDRVLQWASSEFDVAAEEMFPTWLAGAALVMLPPEAGESLEDFTRLVRAERLSVLNLPAALWHSWVEYLEFTGQPLPPDLRLVVTGSDKVWRGHLRRWAALAGERVRWCNGYGPTEATITATICQAGAQGQTPGSGAVVPLGRPLPGARVYVLDGQGAPQPPGLWGEIVIGGLGVARGYLGRPGLTAAVFRPDPFAPEPGARAYWTGDQGRFLPDGSLEIAGRLDEQVKIRGYRIEPGEVEAVLAGCPGVRQAVVVVVQPGQPGQAQLAAAVTGEPAPDPAACRAWLEARLPGYMVPPVIKALPALPLTSRGKLDRRGLARDLAATVSEHPEAQGGDEAATPLEKALAAIWGQALGLARVGRHDNFFELGGDSILSLRLVTLARRQGLALTLKQIFQHQTIAGLARVVGAAALTAAEPERGGPLPLAPIQAWFHESVTAAPNHFNQAMMLAAPDDLDVQALAVALQALVDHHPMLRLRSRVAAEGVVQEPAPLGSPAPLEVIAQPEDGLPPDELRAALARTQAGLDILHGPLLRGLLLRHPRPGQTRLLLAAHHLAVDAVSWAVLLEDLSEAYRQARAGRPPSLLPVGVTYRSWVERLAGLAASPELAAEAAYWEGLLGQAHGGWLVQEPSRPARAAAGEGGQVVVELSAPETRRVLRSLGQGPSQALDAKAHEVLLAALLAAAREALGRERLLVDLEGHGRDSLEDLDLSRTVGWFTLIRPVSLGGLGLTDPASLVRAVRGQVRQAPRGGLGHGLLRHLAPDQALRARMAGLPRPGILFNYLGEMGGLGGNGEFIPRDEDPGPLSAPGNQTSHPLEINAGLWGGSLRVSLAHTGAVEGRDVAALAEALARTLRAWGRAATARGRARQAADFPLAGLEPPALESLLAQVERLSPGAEVEDVLPLSPLQEGLLFHSLQDAQADPYHDQLELHLEGPLNVEVCRAVWQELVDRHQILRSGFHWQGLERPRQVVLAEAALPWRVEDLRDAPPAAQDERLREIRAAERAQAFDPGRPPLMGLVLARLAEERWVLIHSAHHLVLDGWSLSVLLGEFFGLYQARTEGRPSPLAPAAPYASFLAWLAGQDQQAAGEFWRGQLAGFDEPTLLARTGVKRQGAAVPEAGLDERQLSLTREETQALMALARRGRLTLSSLVQGAWALLLGQYAGCREVIFGVTVSGRPPELAGAENMVGLLINTIPLRVSIQEQAPVLAWLARLQDRFLECGRFAHQPLAEIRKASDLGRESELFDTLVLVQNYPLPGRLAAGALRLAGVKAFEGTNFPLVLACQPGEALRFLAVFSAQALDGQMVQGVLERLRELLLALAVQADAPLAQALRPQAAQRQALLALGRGLRQEVKPPTMPANVDAWAARAPQAPALAEDGGAQWTYAQLSAASDHLAHWLKQRGVGPETMVGLCLPRGGQLVVATLAIMKAGGCLVPLDPAYPRERLEFMLGDCAAPMMLTKRRLLAQLPQWSGQAMFLDDYAPDQLDAPAGRAGLPAPDLETAAYVIYTSGSTGRPKGVVSTHAGLGNLMHNQRLRLGLTPADRVLQFSSPSFDTSIWEMGMAMAAGACLCLAAVGDLQPGPPLLALLERMRVSMVTLPPAALASMEWQPLPHLRGMMVAGEFCPPGVAARWAPERRFYNGYGPTECAVASTTHLRAPDEEQMPLGETLANLDLLLLDAEMEPVPPGAVGEIYMGGVGLARGYWGRPGLTAEKFLPNPYGPPGSRLYRSGDQAYRGPGDGLWFAGRTDHQIKLRGYRIELGEIESALTQHPAIDNAVVLVRQEADGRRFLVAHVETPAPLEAQVMRDFLGQRLPGYMIPARFVRHAAFPLTPNAKADRAALARAPLPSDAGGAGGGQPRGPREEALCAIWAQVLGLDRVGRDDNFLSLGGDSILAIQAVGRANAAGLAITIGQIMNPATQTVAALVAALAGQAAPEPGPPQDELTTAPLTPIQRWFFALGSPEPHHYNMSLLLRVPAGLDAARLERAGQALIGHHQALRLRFIREGDAWRQTLEDVTARPCLTVVDLRELAPEAARQRLQDECRDFQRSLDLARPPLMRLILFRLPEALGDRLLMVPHHLAVDAVSCQFLVEDLFDGYRQAGESAAIKLPAPSTPYLQWSSRLAAYAASPAALAELEHWAAPPSAGTPLPRRRGAPGAPARSGDYDQESLVLEREDTAALLRQAPGATGCRMHEIILAALARAVAGITGGRSVAVELEGNGRQFPSHATFGGVNLSRTVGWFTTLAPVVLPVPETGDLAGLLGGVRAAVRGQPGQGFGHGALRYLHPQEEVRRTLADRVRPEILFNYLGQWDAGWDAALPVSLAPEDPGPSFSPATPMPYALQVEAVVLEGRLRLDCRFSPGVLERSLVAGLLRAMRDTLARVVEASAPGEQGRRHGLAPQQLVMLGHSLGHPGGDAYWVQTVFRLAGDLSPQRIQALWRLVLERHAMLRGRFHWPAQGLPTQCFAPEAQAVWREEDWRGLDPADLARRLEGFLTAQRRRELALGQGTPMSFTLARTDDHWRLIWAFHHAVLDGWSMSVVRQDLERAPALLDQGAEAPPPGAGMPDFLDWLRRQDQAGARSFWGRELRDLSPQAVWPARGGNAARAGYHFQERRRPTRPGTGQALAALARRHNLTPATLALGAWALTQSRLSASPEVVFGVTTALRPPEVEGIGEVVGPLTNTLPLRLRLDPGRTLAEWLGQVQARRNAQAPHAHLPLAELAQACGIDDGDALFATAVRFQNHPAERERGEGSWLEVLRVCDFWHYPLNIEVEPGAGFCIILTWDEQALATPRAEAILDELVGTLELFAAQGLDRELSDYLGGPAATA